VLLDDTTKHSPDFKKLRHDSLIFFAFQVLTSHRCIKPMPSFLQFAIGVCALTQKVCRITPFRPSLRNISSNGTRTSANLVRKRVFFFRGPRLAKLENHLLHFEGCTINIQFPKTLHSYSHFTTAQPPTGH